MKWKKILKSLGIGIGFIIVAYMLSGSDVNAPMGLLVVYLEYRFGA